MNVLLELCLLESCDYRAVQCRADGVCAPIPIHPFVGRAQGTSETSENKCADIQKVNHCLQQDQLNGNCNVPVPSL